MLKVFDAQVEHEDDDSEEEFIYSQGASLGHAATAKATCWAEFMMLGS